MENEEQVFDFMAAAEETGRQLNEMARRLPGEMKAVLAEEWRKSPWLAELPKVAAEARAAMEKTESATRFLNRSVKIAGIIVCLASVIIPLVLWGVAYLNLTDLRQKHAALELAKSELSATIAHLKSETGGGAELSVGDDGVCVFILPTGIPIDATGHVGDGRVAIKYKLPR